MSFWEGVATRGAGSRLLPEAGAERLLAEAARRAAGQGGGQAALAVRLGGAPGAQPHHRRVARAMLEEAARHQGGQVFAPRNGDLLLLAPPATLHPRGRAESLPDSLARLLGEVGTGLVAVWPLPAERGQLLAYAAARLAETDQPADPSAEPRARPDPPVLSSLLHRQTGVLFAPRGTRLLHPLFRAIGASNAALLAQPGADALAPDPCLLRHLAGQAEARLLTALPGELGKGGALDPAAGPPLHLKLSPAGVLSGPFARVAELCAERGIGLGVEIALVEAAADPAGLAAARTRLEGVGIGFVLDGVSAQALRLTEPGSLGAGLVKLDWAANLPARPAAEQRELGAALDRLGPERVVLARADSEAALQWGLARGLRRFQGSQVDAMLAAARIAACPAAARCTPRQCIERASASGAAGRAGCANLALLDAGAPA